MQSKVILKSELTKEILTSILHKIKDIKVGVIGDGCLDVYWDVDMRLSQLSRETPHYPLPVVNERIYPGGGSNVAWNMKDLGASQVYMLSVIGDDWRAQCLISKLEEKGVDTQFMITDQNRITPAYCKPMKRGYSDLIYEDARIDFENHAPISKDTEAKIIENLHQIAKKVDIIAVCDQFEHGIVNENIRKELENLGLQGKKIIVDSRSRIGLYRHAIIKPNEMEAMGAAFNADYTDTSDFTLQNIIEGTYKLYLQNKAPVIVTLGSKGSLWYDGNSLYMADAVPVEPPIDIVGAGDAFLSAFSLAYGAGFEGHEAIAFGNMASSVVIQKIGMAGTVTSEELFTQFERVKAYEK